VIKVMHSYYKGVCTLDALLIVYFYANRVVFNWCNYLLEELLVTCEEAEEKGRTFTYGYLLVVFSMWKCKPPMGRKLASMDKGCLEKMFESYHVRPD
jgi:hypothetical protein